MRRRLIAGKTEAPRQSSTPVPEGRSPRSHSSGDNQLTSKTETPATGDYLHIRTLNFRWKDNDVYGHVNNVECYPFFDAVTNTWLIEEGGLDIHGGETIGVCAESDCRFPDSVAFPEVIKT